VLVLMTLLMLVSFHLPFKLMALGNKQLCSLVSFPPFSHFGASAEFLV
jgi:hypothetical protein